MNFIRKDDCPTIEEYIKKIKSICGAYWGNWVGNCLKVDASL